MNEENKQKVEEVGKEDSVGTKENGDKYETTPVIERAREEREKMEDANTKREEVLEREEAIMIEGDRSLENDRDELSDELQRVRGKIEYIKVKFNIKDNEVKE